MRRTHFSRAPKAAEYIALRGMAWGALLTPHAKAVGAAIDTTNRGVFT